MLYALGVIIFAVGLILSIALHELGHMAPAKKFGVKVTQYMVGFGPTLWSRRKGDTEYGLKWIPLGGYCRMIGMVPPRVTNKPSRWPRRMATAVEEFRNVSRAEVLPEDSEREFYRLTPGKKMIVMLGGPTMNLVIYLVLTIVLLGALGLPQDEASTSIASVSKCVAPVNAPAAKQTDCAAPNSPAAIGGLRPGDKIVSVNGTAITSWDQLVKIVEPSVDRQLVVTVERNGTQQRLPITPVGNEKCSDNACTRPYTAGYIGVSPADHHYYKQVGLLAIPGEVGTQLHRGWDALLSYPQKLKSLWDTVFDNTPRDPAGAIGIVGIGRIGGEYAETNLLSNQDKVFALISLLASVNLLLFFFNLLPLLPLDGGHVAGAMTEATKRGLARLRRRRRRGNESDADDGEPDKQIFVDTAQMLPVMYAVGSVLVLLTLLTFYADIFKPVQLFGG